MKKELIKLVFIIFFATSVILLLEILEVEYRVIDLVVLTMVFKTDLS